MERAQKNYYILLQTYVYSSFNVKFRGLKNRIEKVTVKRWISQSIREFGEINCVEQQKLGGGVERLIIAGNKKIGHYLVYGTSVKEQEVKTESADILTLRILNNFQIIHFFGTPLEIRDNDSLLFTSNYVSNSMLNSSQYATSCKSDLKEKTYWFVSSTYELICIDLETLTEKKVASMIDDFCLTSESIILTTSPKKEVRWLAPNGNPLTTSSSFTFPQRTLLFPAACGTDVVLASMNPKSTSSYNLTYYNRGSIRPDMDVTVNDAATESIVKYVRSVQLPKISLVIVAKSKPMVDFCIADSQKMTISIILKNVKAADDDGIKEINGIQLWIKRGIFKNIDVVVYGYKFATSLRILF